MPNQSMNTEIDEKYMKIALEQAGIAEDNGDVPIGAIIVFQNQIIGRERYQQLRVLRK